MSAQTVRSQTNRQLFVTNDYSNIFLFGNRYINGTYTNGTGSAITLAVGTVMGRIASSGKLVPLDTDSTDGSQFPVGILSNDYEVEASTDVVVNVCIAGDVNENFLVFEGEYDDLDSIVDDRTLRDRIAGDTMGIFLVAPTDLSEEDNY